MPVTSRHQPSSGGQRPTRAPAQLDARDPFVFDVRELGRRPGAMKRESRTVPARGGRDDDLVWRGLAGGALDVPVDAELRLDVRFESVVEGVLVTGTVAAELDGECVRCLDPVEVDLEAPFQELYFYPGDDREPDGEHESDEDALWLVGDRLDTRPVVHDAVVLALPAQPLCRPDCPGLCPQCGARLADDPGHRHEGADPRWEALRAFASGGGANGAGAQPDPKDEQDHQGGAAGAAGSDEQTEQEK